MQELFLNPDAFMICLLPIHALNICQLILVISCILQDQYVTEQSANNDTRPLVMNAFEMITLSQGLNLSALFDRHQVQYLQLAAREVLNQSSIYFYFLELTV